MMRRGEIKAKMKTSLMMMIVLKRMLILIPILKRKLKIRRDLMLLIMAPNFSLILISIMN